MAHLTKEQRYTLQILWKRGVCKREIAAEINVHPTTVARELKKNCRDSGSYNYSLADKKYRERLSCKKRHVKFTDEVKDHVISHLEQDYSPEQIVGFSARKGFPCVSHETIYKWIWEQKKQGKAYHEHLRRRGRTYAKRGGKNKPTMLNNRISIDDRPPVVDKKTRVGDLEVDTIIGKNHQGAILTVNDRLTGYCWIGKLNGKDAEQLAEKCVEKLLPYKGYLHTITSDNGNEFTEWSVIATGLGVDYFFCHPYHSWERGANENLNGLIRQYFVKSCDFENITQDDCDRVAKILNTRPRKRLNYRTPHELFFEKIVC